MKKQVLKSSLLAGITALLLTFGGFREGTLTDITKPYLGEYECKSATLGNEEYVDEFSYIILELKADETFVLRYKTKNKTKGEEKGEYSYDKEKETITLTLGEKSQFKREFSLKKGAICIEFPVGAKLFVMRFEQK